MRLLSDEWSDESSDGSVGSREGMELCVLEKKVVAF